MLHFNPLASVVAPRTRRFRVRAGIPHILVKESGRWPHPAPSYGQKKVGGLRLEPIYPLRLSHPLGESDFGYIAVYLRVNEFDRISPTSRAETAITFR